jgi:hypothetical protein
MGNFQWSKKKIYRFTYLLTLPLFAGVSRVRALSPAWTRSHAREILISRTHLFLPRAERPILLRFLNVLTTLNDFIIKRIVFLFLVKYIASGTLSNSSSILKLTQDNSALKNH